MRQAGGKLAERRQAFGAAGFGLGEFQAAIGLGELFGQVW